MSYFIDTKQIAVPTTGQTVNIVNADRNIVLLINPAGTLLALTVAMPTSPKDGQKVSITSSQVLTGLTMTSGGTILGALTTIAAVNGFATWCYDLASTSWFRIG